MFWDGLRIKATPFAGVKEMNSVKLVVAVIGKKQNHQFYYTISLASSATLIIKKRCNGILKLHFPLGIQIQ